MGEINFLTNDVSDSNGKKNHKNKLPVSKNNDKDGGVYSVKKDNDSKDDKKRIEKSRQEILKMIDKNKKRKKEKDKKKEKKNDVGSSGSWLGKIFTNNAKKTEKTKTVKKNKEEQADLKVPKKIQQVKKDEFNEQSKKNEKENTSNNQKSLKDSPFIFNSNTWNSSGVLATNLIDKSEFNFFDSEKKLKYIIISILGSLCMVGVLYLGLLYWEHVELSKLKKEKNEIANLEIKINGMEKDINQAKNFQEKLNVVGQLLEKHVYWTNFFSFLEEKTLPNVYYTGDFNASLDGEYKLSARAPSFSVIKNQISVLNNDNRVSLVRATDLKVYEETVEGAKSAPSENEESNENEIEATTTKSVIEKGIDFTLSFKIEKDIFHKSAVMASTSTKSDNY